MQALIMAAALAGLAPTCGRALWEEDRHAPSPLPSGLVEVTATAKKVEAAQ
jgi:hypothetical protein